MMKKYLFLFLGLAIAASASAGFPVKRDVRQGLKSLESITQRTAPRHASGMKKAPVIDAPEGEVKYYSRTGSCLYVESNYVQPGDQEGLVELTFASDNKVWFKNIFYGVGDNYGDSYVYGTLSDDGTKITVPMGQSIYYSSTYDADVVLSWGTTYVDSNIRWAPDEEVTEAVYVVEGNTIKLQGGGPAPSGSDYPDYEAEGLGSVWTDDASFGGYLEWGTVLTLTDFVPATLPTNVMVTPDFTFAKVTWNGAEGDNWNLRWRPWTDTSNNPYFWDFPLDSYEEQAEGWWLYDADGDGNNWGFAYSNTDQTDVCFTSESYDGTALSPDNYLGTPTVPLKGELRFTLWGRSDSYPDTLQVYAMVNDELYQLFEDDLASTVEHKTYTVDLSAFEGAEGCIVFRHYNCTDQWKLYIDDVFIGDPADIVEPAEWIYANDLTSAEYTIDGLTPETKYEVQVQASRPVEGEEPNISDWSEVVSFTTLANAEVTVSVAATATDGEYNYATLFYSDKNLAAPEGIKAYTATVADGEITLHEISGAIPAGTAVVLKTDSKLTETTDFQFTEVAEAAAVEAENMLQGTDEATTISGEGKYYMLSLNEGSEENSVGFYFDKESNGGTQLKNAAHKAYLVVPEGGAVKGYTFSGDDATGIGQIVGEKSANEVYDLQGRRVVRPENGIYIVNGKKIVVK